MRKAREAVGLTQEKLAFQAGLSREYVNQLEQDLKSPTVTVLSRLAKPLRIKVWQLLKRAGV